MKQMDIEHFVPVANYVRCCVVPGARHRKGGYQNVDIPWLNATALAWRMVFYRKSPAKVLCMPIEGWKQIISRLEGPGAVS